MSEERIEDLPIFADTSAEQSDGENTPAGRGSGSSTTSQTETDRPVSDRGDRPDRTLVNLVDYSRSPARPRKPDADPKQAAEDRPTWVDRGLDDIARRGSGPRRSENPEPTDWGLVAAFRAQTSNRLTEWSRANPSAPVDEQQQQGRLIIGDLLETAAREAMTEGRGTWTLDQQSRLAEAVFDATFRLGRLQPLIDDTALENIEIRSNGPALVEYGDGVIEYREPVAETDAELIEFLAFLGSRSDNERSFSAAQPRLHLRLDGGARLAASAWVTPHPIVVIRRHRLVRVSLEELADLGEFDLVLASFLRAAVRADKSIVVSGSQGAGKTTLLRALCGELPPDEHIGTFETEYELHLHEMPDRHSRVDAFEARPGTGELGIDGRRAGEVTLNELLIDSFRFNERRQIVGEVRGREIITMIKAMQSGSGSMSTTHAKNARAAINKLVTCALEAGAHISQQYAERALAEGVDLIVHVDLETVPTPDGRWRRSRRVSEVIAVEWGGDGVSYTDVFKPNTAGEVAPNVLPDDYRTLARFGFDLPSYLAGGGSYSQEYNPHSGGPS